jgi:hypothetical protein
VNPVPGRSLENRIFFFDDKLLRILVHFVYVPCRSLLIFIHISFISPENLSAHLNPEIFTVLRIRIRDPGLGAF